ncbi:DNA (cytosine-5-)-methyltransferase [Staphylococcus saprophyticus]|nr:DNA (cytosine-5-)-methyltransferase [Staphylococcus saprophyticus]
MNFIDICSGIGGFRSALEMNGHNCLAFAEIDKYAKQSYRAIYDTEGEDELDDITAITDEHFRLYRGQCDIITGGFPCQAFSIAGNRRGFDDTRGTIFFHIARAIKEIQPSYVLLENVKGLFSHDKGRTFGTIIQALDELGYVTEWGLFNSKYWGVPQNRERVYILVTRKDKFKGPVLFDLLKQQTEVTTRLIDVLEDEVDEKYYLSEEKTKKLTININVQMDNEKSTVPVLTPDRLNKRQNGRRFKEDGEPMFTLTSQDRHGIAVREATKQGYALAEQGDSVNVSYPTSKTRRGRVGKQVAQTLQAGEVNQGVVINPLKDKTEYGWHFEQAVYDSQGITRTVKANGGSGNIPKTIEGLRIRKLTPLECWRLQGFTDEQFYKAKDNGVSNSQLYKQAGNSVTVNVVDEIVKCL